MVGFREDFQVSYISSSVVLSPNTAGLTGVKSNAVTGALQRLTSGTKL